MKRIGREFLGYVHGFKNETDLNSLSSAVCLASAMQRGPPGEGGPHPPADCECRLCVTFRKVAGLLFGADTSQLLRDRCRPYIEGLYTQLLEIALEVRGTAASGSGGAGQVGGVRPGGPTPPKPAAEPAGDGGDRGDPIPEKDSPGPTGVKKEEEEVEHIFESEDENKGCVQVGAWGTNEHSNEHIKLNEYLHNLNIRYRWMLK